MYQYSHSYCHSLFKNYLRWAISGDDDARTEGGFLPEAQRGELKPGPLVVVETRRMTNRLQHHSRVLSKTTPMRMMRDSEPRLSGQDAMVLLNQPVIVIKQSSNEVADRAKQKKG